MPPLKTFRHGAIFNDAFKARGIPLAPMPVSINSTEYKGRPACVNCGWCHVGCAIGAHATPLVGHLPEARKRGAEVRPFSYVTRVLTNGSGDRVTGVEYYDAKREQHVQPAAAVVLAAYSAEIPRIMLNSEDRQAPEGPVQQQRTGRQVSDVPPDVDRLGDVRRGRAEPHGHRRLSIHVVRALRQDHCQERLRQHLHSHRFSLEAELPASRAPGPICSASRSPTT